MPSIVDRLVGQLQKKGFAKGIAFAIATKRLQKAKVLKKGTRKLTKKGQTRSKMTPAQRAKSRAAKGSKKSPKSFKFNPKTNRAVLKKK